MTLAPSAVMEVTLQGMFRETNQVLNTFHLWNTGEVTVTDEQMVFDALAFGNEIAVMVAPACTAQMAWNGVYMRNYDTNQVFGFQAFASPVVGTISTADTCPPGVAGLLTFRTYVSRCVLRKYFGVFAENQIDANGNLAASAITLLNGIGAYLLAELDLANSTYQYVAVRATAPTIVVPTSYTAQPVVAYQRRRRTGVGS